MERIQSIFSNALWHVLSAAIVSSWYTFHGNLIERLCQKKLRMGTKEYSTIDAMKHCQVPVLFVHGTDDTFVPVSMTYENYQACTAPKQLLVVPGAGHGLSYYMEKERYEKVVKDFWGVYHS